MSTKGLKIILAIFVVTVIINTQCVHHKMVVNSTKHFYNDLEERRLLADQKEGRLRIFVDYTQVKQGGATQINTVKRATNITASYFYRILNVTRLQKLKYPAGSPLQCNSLIVPAKYVSQGAIGDLGVICGNVDDSSQVYVAKSIACAFLESDKRPIWGIMVWNNAFLKYDQEGFQEMVYVGIHQMTHILGFSAVMYELFKSGTPLIQLATGENFLSSPSINRQVRSYFGCNNGKGLPLEDQDGTLIGSHWERKVVGNQMMIASNRKSAFTSRFTLALLESSGWYTSVDYEFSEPTNWGKNQGCNFLNIDNCEGEQFCQDSQFGCDTDGTAIGRCGTDLFTGACKIVKYFTNTICVDENFEIKNLNAQLNAFERGGYLSRCFDSSYRQEGLVASKLNNRCYNAICSMTKTTIYILVASYIVVCRSPGQVIPAPVGFEGTLTCPKNFKQYCDSKKTCPYHCNKNGVCIDGKCVCTGTTQFATTCVDVSILLAPIGNSGGLMNALYNPVSGLDKDDILNPPSSSEQVKKPTNRVQIKKYSVYSKCLSGTFEDKDWGMCLKCSQVFNCQECDDGGCITCDNGRTPNNRICAPNTQNRR